MKYAHLGRTGLQVSRIGLGTLAFGWKTSEADSFAIMDQALELGINLIDTANVYGEPQPPADPGGKGIAEQIIGRWLAQGGRRERVVLATKVYQPMGPGPNDRGLSAYHIRKACEDSLRRLQTDHIDLYQMHHIDRATPWEEIWQAIETLVQQGKVIYVGSSNFAGWHIAAAQAAAAARHFMGLVSEQSKYNLKDRAIELEVIPACRAYGLGLLPWRPLGAGLLAGATSSPTGQPTDPVRQREIERYRPQLEAYEQFCRERGFAPADVALAWLLHNPVVPALLSGPETLDQLTGSMRALSITLSAEDLARLDVIWPSPGGEAPEAYAW
jgi:aryl-alcohol dehydrogenase-like predicted oxidoreductase